MARMINKLGLHQPAVLHLHEVVFVVGADSPVAQENARAVWKPNTPGRYVIFGHIGDAHVHVNIFSSDAAPTLERFARHAVAFGGTVSAEHGLGKRKAGYLALQYEAADI